MNVLEKDVSVIDVQRMIQQVEQLNKEMARTIENVFYAEVRALRAQGMTEPHIYHKALETLNNAVKPFNEAYRA
jgi:sensor histidine kinase YesM